MSGRVGRDGGGRRDESTVRRQAGTVTCKYLVVSLEVVEQEDGWKRLFQRLNDGSDIEGSFFGRDTCQQ